jgi:hypothetical protein
MILATECTEITETSQPLEYFNIHQVYFKARRA